MKTLSKLHQEAITKAKTVDAQNEAAAMAMIETPIEMIKTIMLKHELAVIEVMRELHEAKESAVKAEREKVAYWMMQQGYATGHGDTIEELLAELLWQIAEKKK